MNCNLPASSVHGISQARILEWVSIPSSRVSSWRRDRTCISCIGSLILYHWATREAQWKAIIGLKNNILETLRHTEKAMAPHSSTLAWKIPWMEEPSRLKSMGSFKVGQDWATSLSLFTFMHWRRKWQPTPVFLPGESQGQGGLWAAVYGVSQSRTWLKWLSKHMVCRPICWRTDALVIDVWFFVI